MLKYQLAAIALKAFSTNALTTRAYRKLGNVVGQRRRLAVPDLPIYTARGNLLVALARKYSAVSDGSKVLEVGTGWMHWFSIYLRLFYKVKIDAFDVWDNRQFMALQSAAAKLRLVFNKDAADPKVLANLDIILGSRSFAEIYQRLDINYIIDPTGSLDQFPDAMFDLITSFHVMEHVSADAVQKLGRSFARVIRPGGYMIHQIGIDDHLAHYDSNSSRKQYIVYSESEWKLRFASSIGYINRIQASEWRQLFDQCGFELCEEINETTDISKLRIGPRFQGYSKEDLECTIQTLVYRKRSD